MIEFLYIFAKTVSLIIDLVFIAMMARVIIPFFLDVEESRVYALAFFISEPFVAPVRYVMIKMNWGQDSPIDWAFFMTYMILWLLQSLLPTI